MRGDQVHTNIRTASALGPDQQHQDQRLYDGAAVRPIESVRSSSSLHLD